MVNLYFTFTQYVRDKKEPAKNVDQSIDQDKLNTDENLDPSKEQDITEPADNVDQSTEQETESLQNEAEKTTCDTNGAETDEPPAKKHKTHSICVSCIGVLQEENWPQCNAMVKEMLDKKRLAMIFVKIAEHVIKFNQIRYLYCVCNGGYQVVGSRSKTINFEFIT